MSQFLLRAPSLAQWRQYRLENMLQNRIFYLDGHLFAKATVKLLNFFLKMFQK